MWRKLFRLILFMLDLSKNYFELFSLPVDFKVNTAELASRYRKLQQAIHPDRYANATEQEKRLSMQGATRLNDALNTLKTPLLRAQYLLELKGEDIAAGTSSISDSTFLMEQIELREELAEAKDQADPYAALAALIKRIDTDAQELHEEIGQQLRGNTPTLLTQARETVNKLQFLSKLSTQVEDLEAELDETFI